MTTQQTNPNSSKKPSLTKRLFWFNCVTGAAVLGTVLALSSVPERATAVTSDELEPSVQYSRGVTGNYLSGRFAANIGDFHHANLYLSRTLRLDPDNMEIAGYAYRMKLITGDMKQAEELAKVLYAAEDSESNPEIMVLLSAIKSDDFKSAEKVLATFEKTGFNQVVIPLVNAWLQYGKGELAEPFEPSKLLEQVGEFAPFIHYQTALINDLGGYEDVALSQYEKALSLSTAMPYRVVELLGNLYERRGEWEKAEALYARYLTQNPDSMLEMPDNSWMIERNRTPDRVVNNVREGVAEIFFSTASILHNEQLNEEALIYIQEVLYLNPEFIAARLMHGTILEGLGRHEDALEAFARLAPDTPYYEKAQLRKAYTLNAMGRSDESLELLDKLSGKMDERYQVFLTKGDVLMREKRYAEATTAYTDALERIESIEAQQWPILYARGISAERSDNWDLAEKDFLRALELEPNQPDVMNYLGYSWLTKQMRMDEAKELISKAVKARPTDAHIIDSMGWALYSIGEYAEAVNYLERAIELMPTDPTVNEHLGDVYWRTGRKTEARFQWKRAILFGAEPEHAETLEAKLEDGLPSVGETMHSAAGDGNSQKRADIATPATPQP